MSERPDYAWALECWREMMTKYKAGRPRNAAPPTLLAEPDGECWYDRCVFPHCDCEQRTAAIPKARGEA